MKRLEKTGPLIQYTTPWLDSIHHIEPKSKSTLVHYAIAIRKLSCWMGAAGLKPEELTPALVTRFQREQEHTSNRRAVAYICGRGAQLYDWLRRNNTVSTNPFRDEDVQYRIGKKEKQEEYYRREERFEVGREALDRLRKDPDAIYAKALIGMEPWQAERDRFLFEFILNTGLRLGEMLRATRGDLNRKNRFLRISIAKSSSRQVPMVLAQPALKRWLPVLTQQFGSGDDVALYPRTDGQPYGSQGGPREALHSILIVLGVKQKLVGPHILRHLFHARLQESVPPHIVSAITGNSIAVQVSHYSHTVAPEVAERALRGKP